MITLWEHIFIKFGCLITQTLKIRILIIKSHSQ